VGARVVTGYDLEIENGGSIHIGDDVSISSRALLSSRKGGEIRVADNCFFGHNVKIVSDRARIVIGEDCLVAENVSIRAGNHGIRAETLIRLQENTAENISIGKDVWIGSGVVVLAGSNIADGCVIGANSVVRGFTEANTIYAGAPIRKIGLRSKD
jgi:acetyltransferase-like isoleucine patch superfamily enzyme